MLSIPTSRPIVIVTGANSGVGFGICHRLLTQLSQSFPPDSQINLPWDHDDAKPQKYDGLTLVMACRNVKLATAARTKLYALLHAHIKHLKRLPGYDGHADVFLSNLQIDVHYVDLALMDSVLKFSSVISDTYPYISHLHLNAGFASFVRIYWPVLFRQLLRDPLEALSEPLFYMQNSGERTKDGFGRVWQCNVFSHFVIYRLLQSKLLASSISPRVIWMSSSKGKPKFADPEDWQLVETETSYEGSKYQIELLAAQLDREKCPIRHIIVQPGVSFTNVGKVLTGWFCLLEWIHFLGYYFARLLGSKEHTIKPYTAASSAVELSLVPLSHVPVPSKTEAPIKYCAQTDMWGYGLLGFRRVLAWEESQVRSIKLLAQCDQLLKEVLDNTRQAQEQATDSEPRTML